MFHKEASEEATLAPTVAVLNIGNELLRGEIRNTNGRWLGAECDRLGLSLVTVGVVPDDVARIADFVNWARFRHDVVLCTGGLGPTPDDVTREAVAAAFGVPCETDPERRAELIAAGGHMDRLADPWSRRPAGGRWLAGIEGGAPSFAIGNVYALAGDPDEMQGAFERMRGELGRWPAAIVWRHAYEVTEDRISDALDAVALACDGVIVCSYPRRTSDRDDVEIVLRALTPDALERAVAILRTQFVEAGIVG
ncbi:MAG TPA: molybdopterin-binding protein [Candidatus Limnocylindrales bacterium]|jgi:molybdenum cofactor synthesis domain-containing protein|nr:molybdopterin-binding protein [Candidatus Limnocylindrales bacterium]